MPNTLMENVLWFIKPPSRKKRNLTTHATTDQLFASWDEWDQFMKPANFGETSYRAPRNNMNSRHEEKLKQVSVYQPQREWICLAKSKKTNFFVVFLWWLFWASASPRWLSVIRRRAGSWLFRLGMMTATAWWKGRSAWWLFSKVAWMPHGWSIWRGHRTHFCITTGLRFSTGCLAWKTASFTGGIQFLSFLHFWPCPLCWGALAFVKPISIFNKSNIATVNFNALRTWASRIRGFEKNHQKCFIHQLYPLIF